MKKKVYKPKMLFSVITKNLNWEILTKNLVILKDGMGLRMKNFNIMGFTEKYSFQGRGVPEKPIYRGNCLKWGGSEGGVFELEGVVPQCTL